MSEKWRYENCTHEKGLQEIYLRLFIIPYPLENMSFTMISGRMLNHTDTYGLSKWWQKWECFNLLPNCFCCLLLNWFILAKDIFLDIILFPKGRFKKIVEFSTKRGQGVRIGRFSTKKNNCLKHWKWPKMHFKTNLFLAAIAAL